METWTARTIEVVAILLVLGVVGVRAHAQPDVPWVVIPASTSDLARERMVIVTHAVERELQRRGQPVLATGAGTMVEQRHSAPAATIPPDVQQALHAALSAGRQELALERLAEARAALEPVDRLADAELDQLRHTEARWLFEVCVMRAALLQKGTDAKRAKMFMQGCVRSYPGFDAPTHPNILRLFEETRSQMAYASLDVSGPAGCVVRFFGIDVGRSPLRLERVAVGPTPVQLECSGLPPSRRHIVQVRAGLTTVQIDPRFDDTLRTEPDSVQLVYSSTHTRSTNLDADAEHLSRLLGGRALLLVSNETDSRQLVISVHALSIKRAAIGDMHLDTDTGISGVEVSRIAHALSTQDEPPRDSPSPVTLSPSTEREEPKSSAPSEAEQTGTETTLVQPLGITLGVLGAGSLIASWVVYAERQNFRMKARPELTEEVTSGFRRRAAWMMSLGVVGAVSLVAAEFLVLPKSTDGGVPVAAWLSTTVGLISFAVGATYMITGAKCDPMVLLPGTHVPRECYAQTADALFGPLLMISSVPLINVTLTYLLRDWLEGSTASLTVRGTGAAIDVRF